VCAGTERRLQLWGDLGCDEFEVIQVVQIECLQVEPGDAVLGESTYPVGRGSRVQDVADLDDTSVMSIAA
jgi:hypothetical protein